MKTLLLERADSPLDEIIVVVVFVVGVDVVVVAAAVVVVMSRVHAQAMNRHTWLYVVASS